LRRVAWLDSRRARRGMGGRNGTSVLPRQQEGQKRDGATYCKRGEIGEFEDFCWKRGHLIFSEVQLPQLGQVRE
jgi:hypothetical protein